MKKIRYKIIDYLCSFAIRWEGSWKYDKEKKKEIWVDRDWAIRFYDYCWWLKWQHTLKYYGEQDWCPFYDRIDTDIAEYKNIKYGEKRRLLFKILIG